MRPSSVASASDTPGCAESALVWAVNRAHPAVIRRCTNAPLGVWAPTVSTPRSSSGWCTTSRSAPAVIASSTTAAVASTANITVVTEFAGSPHTRPTESQLSASRGGYAASSTSMISARVGAAVPVDAITRP
ncbi:hypothetical protein QE449_001728 [Rhodococcus sp. SORGH_AS303]|nr:hypothetical protein [Rhodococcus sp. SORGH_AS_0303]